MRHLGAVILTLCLGQLALAKSKKEIKNFQVGLTLKQYEYLEPSLDLQHKGLIYGVWGEWLWGSPLGNGRTLGDLALGTIDYQGGICDTITGDCEPYSSTTFDVISKITSRLEYTISRGTKLFSGLGGRYYYDMGNGSIFYRRTGTWVYIPFGGIVDFDTSMGNLFFDFQYDFIVYGRLESKVSDAIATEPDVNHTQSGHGISLTAGLQNDDYSWAAFYEKWDLNESDVVSGYIEPANTGTSIGLKLGYKF